MDSRHLGPVVLEGGAGGGWMDSTVTIAGAPVPFRLEIDFPGRLDDIVLRNIDLALDSLASLDELARATIASALERRGSAPAAAFEDWGSHEANDAGDSEEFLRLLRPSHFTLLPDGGPDSLDRIVVSYAVSGSATDAKITVRFREGIGAELDPAPRRQQA